MRHGSHAVAYQSPAGDDGAMRRSARKKAAKQLGPGDVLMAVADAQSAAPWAETPIGVFDPQHARMFRMMLMDRYSPASDATIGDSRIPTKTLFEAIAQGDPTAEESTLAAIVMSAVIHAAHERREPRLAAQIAMEGVMAAMRYPKYAAKRSYYATDDPDDSDSG